MAKKGKSIFESKGWKVGMKYLYGIGASVVIVGALFKILHLPGANEMLIVGLGTEAVIFFFSAFEPLPAEEEHYDWAKVFPQLRVEDDDLDEFDLDELGTGGAVLGSGGGLPGLSIDQKTVESMQNTMTPELFDSLNESVKALKNNVENLADISDATVATNEFSQKVRAASSKMDQLSAGYSVTVDAMNAMGNSVNDVKQYQEQIQGAARNLSSLNAVYELELQDAQKHLNSINKFYGSIAGVMQNLLDTSNDTNQLRQEVSNLAQNMHSLNNIYGSMLTAMASASARQ
ncbi:MAG: gliding motility protein GldL [Sphingobacteriia bacterium]|jgi:gliding motility-associated protein GldL